VILDAKRGDIGHTNDRYAEAAFNVLGAAAITVSPFLGRDSVEAFSSHVDRGVFVLCRTSNPGAKDIQDLVVDGRPLYLEVARRCVEWDIHSNLGLVTGATWPAELAAIRAEAPDLPLLIPGVGFQGGDLAASATAAAGEGGGGLFVMSASRSIMNASKEIDFAHAAEEAALRLRDQIAAALS
jgi:orotidine-5'-phosphate decarboxylase